MSGALPTSGGYRGPAWLLTGTSDLNALDFLIRQVIAGKAFAGLVTVKSVTGGGAAAAPPLVSVTPMVDQVDGNGNRYPHGTIYQVPCFRLQGQYGMVVLDPGEGNTGLAVICHRDQSIVKATNAVSPPGSWRQNDWADGMYFGSFLDGPLDTYVAFGNGSLSLVTPNAGIVISNGTIATTGTLLNNGVHVGSTHEHSGVTRGGGNTDPPI